MRYISWSLLTRTGTVHLAVQSALSCGHVSGLLFRGSVVSGRKTKQGEVVKVVGAGIDSYPLATRQGAAFIILPLK